MVVFFCFFLLIFQPVSFSNSLSGLSSAPPAPPRPYWDSNAGIGEFFHQLFDYTSNEVYAAVSKKNYQWLISKAHENVSAFGVKYTWEYPPENDVLNLEDGCSGIGRVLLRAYQRTGNTTYLHYAEGAAHHLLDTAIDCGNNSITWNVMGTGYMHGCLGIGDFLTDLYLETGQDIYKNYSLRLANWLVGLAHQGNPGYKWPDIEHGDPIHWGIANMTLAADEFALGWCFGSASKIFIFLGNINYLAMPPILLTLKVVLSG